MSGISQLDKNYGKEGAEIIVDNTQLTIFGGFAPNSTSAEVLSKALGSRTVLSGSVIDGLKNHPLTYDDQLVRKLIDCIVVLSKSKIKVVFIGGLEVEQELETKKTA